MGDPAASPFGSQAIPGAVGGLNGNGMPRKTGLPPATAGNLTVAELVNLLPPVFIRPGSVPLDQEVILDQADVMEASAAGGNRAEGIDDLPQLSCPVRPPDHARQRH